MELIRVTKEWQRAGVHFVRAAAMIREFSVSLEGEFAEDTAESGYVLALDGNYPVSTCRLHYLDQKTGKIERVATIGEYRHKGYGAAVIREAEKWMQEQGVKKIMINSRTAAVKFYEKLGYLPDWNQKSGEGDFACVMVSREL